jgi:hypothetical protein
VRRRGVKNLNLNILTVSYIVSYSAKELYKDKMLLGLDFVLI